MKNILLIHGFNGIPKIFEYFKREFEERGFNVFMPSFPIVEETTVEGFFSVFDQYKSFFNEELIVIAHSIGNPMFIKYISKNKLKVGLYISLAGFSRDYYNEGKDALNEKVKLIILNKEELDDTISLARKRFSIFSKTDHLVPYSLLCDFSDEIKSEPISMDEVGHMGKKSGLEELPEVVDIVLKNQF